MLPKPKSCESCIGYQWGGCKGYSRVTGENRVKLLVLGEASGEVEEKKGEPFVGPSGRFINDALRACGLRREDYSWSNVLRCRPPNNFLKGAPWERAALDHCRRYLDDVIAERQPHLILALGDIALRELSTTSGPISDLRGYLLRSTYGIPLLATYHPAHLMPRKDSPGAMHLYGVLLHDIRRAVQCVTRGLPQPLEPSYALNPTDDDIRDFLDRIRSNPALPIAYDIETGALLGLDADRIIQIQFSTSPGTALVLGFGDKSREAVAEVLAAGNPKWDYNGRLFDRPFLRRNGFVLNGEFHDLMEVYAHLQSGFVSNKDDTHGDKGVPSRLMSLQSCLSFYHPEFKPWKAVQFPAWSSRWDGQQLPLPVRLYGAKDVDATIRVGQQMFAALERTGLSSGYRQHKWRLGAVLDDLSARGLPVDAAKQTELRQYIEGEESTLQSELQKLVPVGVLSKKSYKGLPRDLRAALKEQGCKPKKALHSHFCDHAIALARSLGFDFHYIDDGSYEYGLVRLLPFNPGSSQQLLNYIRHRGYPVPRHIDTGKETTGKDAIDLLIQQTDDPVLKDARWLRQLIKIRGTYTEGYWTPQSDGRVHPEWTFGTASGQLTPRKPNAAQFPQHGPLAKKAKAFICAEQGHTFIKRDFRSYHAKSLAWLSKDALYYKIADYDVHSLITAHFLNLPIANSLMELPEQELRAELQKIKSEHADVRNLKAKRAVLGLGFGMGVEKLWRMNPDAFDSTLEAGALIKLIQSLFHKAFVDYPRSIEKRMHRSPRLISPTGHQRWTWAKDLEQAVSFEPANIAHCHMFDSMLIMQDRGLLDRWQLCNMIHDCLIFHCPNELVDECIEISREIMERESTVLVDPDFGPFQCATDLETGLSMAEMK